MTPWMKKIEAEAKRWDRRTTGTRSPLVKACYRKVRAMGLENPSKALQHCKKAYVQCIEDQRFRKRPLKQCMRSVVGYISRDPSRATILGPVAWKRRSRK